LNKNFTNEKFNNASNFANVENNLNHNKKNDVFFPNPIKLEKNEDQFLGKKLILKIFYF